MELVQTLRGKGMGIAPNGRTPVQYLLRIYQKRIPVGNGQTIPGMKQIDGQISPMFGRLGETFSLESEDGLTATFFFTDTQGSVAVNALS